MNKMFTLSQLDVVFLIPMHELSGDPRNAWTSYHKCFIKDKKMKDAIRFIYYYQYVISPQQEKEKNQKRKGILFAI